MPVGESQTSGKKGLVSPSPLTESAIGPDDFRYVSFGCTCCRNSWSVILNFFYSAAPAGRADYAQLMAVTDTEKRARGGITCFAVDLKSPGVLLERQWPAMMGEAPWQIVFDNVRVPAPNVIGAIGGGFSLAQKWIGEGRIRGHGARTVGIARRALDMMIEYAKVRVTFGRPLADRQAIQFMIADSAMELHAVRNMVYECAWRVDRGEDVRDLSYMVKVMATEMASRVVDRAIQVHGGLGLMKELPLEWWYRQIRSTRITEGANEVLRWRLGQNIIRAHK